MPVASPSPARRRIRLRRPHGDRRRGSAVAARRRTASSAGTGSRPAPRAQPGQHPDRGREQADDDDRRASGEHAPARRRGPQQHRQGHEDRRLLCRSRHASAGRSAPCRAGSHTRPGSDLSLTIAAARPLRRPPSSTRRIATVTHREARVARAVRSADGDDHEPARRGGGRGSGLGGRRRHEHARRRAGDGARRATTVQRPVRPGRRAPAVVSDPDDAGPSRPSPCRSGRGRRRARVCRGEHAARGTTVVDRPRPRAGDGRRVRGAGVRTVHLRRDPAGRARRHARLQPRRRTARHGQRRRVPRRHDRRRRDLVDRLAPAPDPHRVVLSTGGLLLASFATHVRVLAVALSSMGLGGAAIWIPSPRVAVGGAAPRASGLAAGLVGMGIGIGIVFAGRLADALRHGGGDASWRDVYRVEAAIGSVVLVAALAVAFAGRIGPAPAGPPTTVAGTIVPVRRSLGGFAALRRIHGWVTDDGRLRRLRVHVPARVRLPGDEAGGRLGVQRRPRLGDVLGCRRRRDLRGVLLGRSPTASVAAARSSGRSSRSALRRSRSSSATSRGCCSDRSASGCRSPGSRP